MPYQIQEDRLNAGFSSEWRRQIRYANGGIQKYLEDAMVVPASTETKYGHDETIHRLLVMANIVSHPIIGLYPFNVKSPEAHYPITVSVIRGLK